MPFARLAFLILAAAAAAATETPSPDFARHEVVRPEFYHVRAKRSVATTRLDDKSHHIHDLTLSFVSRGHKFILDLKLNTNLIPKEYFHKYQTKVRTSS